MLNKSMISTLLAAVAAVTVAVSPAAAQDKLQFRLNWTIYGEHAPFFVAKDKGFYKDEGLDVEILEGSGSTTVAQLVANLTNPIAYVDAATMMRGIGAGMPIKAVGVTLQQSPMAFIYRADAARPTKIDEIKGSRIAITAGDASLAIFTAFMGKLGMSVDDVKLITVANPQSKEQAVLNKQADSPARLFHGSGTAHAIADRCEDGLDPPLRHGRRVDALQRDYRQQGLDQGRQEPGHPATLLARVATWLAIHV